jgi:hypothetical protein
VPQCAVAALIIPLNVKLEGNCGAVLAGSDNSLNGTYVSQARLPSCNPVIKLPHLTKGLHQIRWSFNLLYRITRPQVMIGLNVYLRTGSN